MVACFDNISVSHPEVIHPSPGTHDIASYYLPPGIRTFLNLCSYIRRNFSHRRNRSFNLAFFLFLFSSSEIMDIRRQTRRRNRIKGWKSTFCFFCNEVGTSEQTGAHTHGLEQKKRGASNETKERYPFFPLAGRFQGLLHSSIADGVCFW